MSSSRKPNLDPDQLNRFLGIVTNRTVSVSGAINDQAEADSVLKVLNNPLGNHSAFPDALQDKLRHFTKAYSDRSIRDLVLDPKTDPVLLKAICYCAQEYSSLVRTHVENAIAITIYYVTTANLLVHHHREIAEHSNENLIESFTDLMAKRWLTPEIKQYLDQACKICQEKQDGSEKDKEQLSDKISSKVVNLSSQSNSASKNTTASLDIFVNEIGARVGRFKLLSVLGEGGMGIVYLAEQEQPIKRRVALKVIKPGMDSKRVIARFEAERQALALLDHPNIAHVYDASTTENSRPYFVMEYVKGLPITEFCDRRKLSIEERLGIFLQICHAVHHAHQKGIIHRDIKPSNILVTNQDDQVIPKIIDFGVAKAISQPLTDHTLLTEQGQLFGTPEYMSPEQADLAGEDIDIRSDIYSLGVLLYELLTGTLPFDSKTLRKGGIDHIREVIHEIAPKTPSTQLSSLGEEAKKIAQSRRTEVGTLVKRLHLELEWIPLKAMRKERTERYRSASEFADDIENYLKGTPLLAGPPSTVYRLRKFVRRNRVLVAAVGVVLLVLAIGILASTVFAIGQARARIEAEAVSDLLRYSVLESLNPYRVGGKKITIQSVLDAASKGLEGKLPRAPLAEAEIRHTLGFAYFGLGLYEQSEMHQRKALEIRRAYLGDDDPTTLVSLKTLGWVYLSQSRYREAEQLYTEALQGTHQVLGEEHWSTLESMWSLSCVYRMQGRFDEAEQLNDKGLRISRRVFGEENVQSLYHLLGLAWCYHIRGRYMDAERLLTKGLEISRRVLGEPHMETLTYMRHLGDLYHDQGYYDKAEKLLLVALHNWLDGWPQEHQGTLLTKLSLAWLYQSQGRNEEAESLFDDVLRTARGSLGEAHFVTGHCVHGLGTLYLSQGQYDKAESLLAEAVEIGSRILGRENWATLSAMNNLAKLYSAQGRYDDAEELFLETMEGRQHKLGEDHPHLLETKNDLAVLYEKQGRYDEAEKLLFEALKGRRLKLGDTHPHTLWSINNLINLYEAWRKPEKANEWRAKLSQTEAVEE